MKSRPSMLIVRALKKYGIQNFTLVILEYTNSGNWISKEQKWLDSIEPKYKYNLNPIVGSSKGYKHRRDSIDKIRLYRTGRRDSETTLNKKRNAIRPANTQGFEVTITDIQTGTTTVYKSIRKANKAIKADIKVSYLEKRERIQKEKGIITPYRRRYFITVKNKNQD